MVDAATLLWVVEAAVLVWALTAWLACEVKAVCFPCAALLCRLPFVKAEFAWTPATFITGLLACVFTAAVLACVFALLWASTAAVLAWVFTFA
jgi:hypothetical protein